VRGEVAAGAWQRQRQQCCRWLFCILIACRAEKYATKLTLDQDDSKNSPPAKASCPANAICILKPSKCIRNSLLILFAFWPKGTKILDKCTCSRLYLHNLHTHKFPFVCSWKLKTFLANSLRSILAILFDCIYYEMSAAPYGVAKIETFSGYVSAKLLN